MKKTLSRVNKHRSVQQWYAIVEQYHEQSLSVEAYCKTLGIGTSSFYKWRHKLNSDGINSVPLFVPVQTVPKISPLSRSGISNLSSVMALFYGLADHVKSID